MTAERLLSRGQNPRIEASVKPAPAQLLAATHNILKLWRHNTAAATA